MRLITGFEQNSDEWFRERKGNVMGTTKVTEFTGKKFLKDFWQILADRLVLDPDVVETARDRGHRLEDEAIEKAAKELGKKLYRDENGMKVAMCVSSDDDRLRYSPDDLVEPVNGRFTEDFEAKCFEGAAHLQSVIEGFVPDKTQMLRPFTVNPDLERRYYVFYHDRIMQPKLAMRIITIERSEYEEQIKILAERDREALAKIDEIMKEYF